MDAVRRREWSALEIVGLIVLSHLITVPAALMASQVGTLTTFANGTTADAVEVNANFAAVTAAINDNDVRIPDFSEGSGFFRIGDMQICWGEVTQAVAANSNNSQTTASLPPGCTYMNNAYQVLGSSRSNYGNANNNVDFVAPTNGNTISVRCHNANPNGTSNTAGTCRVNYVTLGPWR